MFVCVRLTRLHLMLGGRMRDRFRGLFGLDAVVPAVLVAAAALMALEPKFFGVQVTDRQIVLGFFAFLGVDALIERSGRLRRIERRLNALVDKEELPPPAAKVLRARSSFDRMDVLTSQARRSLLIIGVNLEGALDCAGTLAALARSGGTVRLVAMDPDGSALAPSAAMSGVDPTLRRGKIVQNLELLRKDLATHLDAASLRRVSLLVTDRVLPLGAVGLDEQTRTGSLIIQHYLADTPAEHAPLFWLRADADRPWYGSYLAQCETCIADARPWDGTRV